MNGVIAFPALFWCHPRFDDWRGKARKESRFLRVLRVLQGNGDLYTVCQPLALWKRNLTGALTSVLDFLREGAHYGIWDWDEAEGRLHLAAWVWEEPQLPQTALPLWEDTRPPSKQPEAASEYQRQRRARLQGKDMPPEQTTSAPAPAEPVPAPASAAHVGSETAQMASYNAADVGSVGSNVGSASANVGSEDTAKAELLAEASSALVCIHTRARARASSVRANPPPAAYPNNKMAPGEGEINRLLQIGHSAEALEDAIAKCQDSPTVRNAGGLGETGWRTWLERKLPAPEAAKTKKLDIVVMSEAKAPPAAPPPNPSVPPAPLRVESDASDAEGLRRFRLDQYEAGLPASDLLRIEEQTMAQLPPGVRRHPDHLIHRSQVEAARYKALEAHHAEHGDKYGLPQEEVA